MSSPDGTAKATNHPTGTEAANMADNRKSAVELGRQAEVAMQELEAAVAAARELMDTVRDDWGIHHAIARMTTPMNAVTALLISAVEENPIGADETFTRGENGHMQREFI